MPAGQLPQGGQSRFKTRTTPVTTVDVFVMAKPLSCVEQVLKKAAIVQLRYRRYIEEFVDIEPP